MKILQIIPNVEMALKASIIVDIKGISFEFLGISETKETFMNTIARYVVIARESLSESGGTKGVKSIRIDTSQAGAKLLMMMKLGLLCRVT
jgi:hypothetical protein